MAAGSDVDQCDLRSASRNGDAELLSQLLANHSFDAGDATAALQKAARNPAIFGMLLQHGADANVVPIRELPYCDAPGELVRLLANHGYDFKSQGHCLLQ